MERLTADERLTLKTGAFGAVFLVSNAVPGVLAMVRESFAASGALAEVGGVVKEALTTGPLPQLPRDSVMEIESVVLPALGRSVEILRAKSPDDVETYRSVVLAAAERVAQAHRGIEPAEAAAIEKIRQALAEAA
ncbi:MULTISPECIES: hypothetical protein [Micromonospora]|jgi:hypothetical protein|uniref:Uncharacterized protein n=1 Tax=Micromonospora tulbaghiae TaxID=479978 RepID=A0A386WS58_9ACTN|nr:MULTISPECIES: hypothetical protein [Micromonospora]AYF29374.1 hypothetical protein CSH63_18250 [Micromonospora tulbaghiae]MCO1615279.1 hypothetical protein [Micromonospora sp. CPM1]NED50743.1 hypothetical protein [Micromonospora aurantiaca]RLQ01316.1 hypothetical protein EAD96_24085 [Micromonospora sp. BL1]